MARVLVYTATYGSGPLQDTGDSVLAQDFEGEMRYEVSWHNPWPIGDVRNVTAQMQRARGLALDGGYDALLTVEHDMRIPTDALQRLWDIGAPVAYGAYMLRHGRPVINVLERYPGPSVNLGESLSLRPAAFEQALRRGVVPASGVGFGCTLIRRPVLERIAFRDEGDGQCADMAFARDCMQAGIRQVADLRVACGHWDGARWLEIMGAEQRVPTVALQDVTARIGMESLTLATGQRYELPEDDASELARAGYVQMGA